MLPVGLMRMKEVMRGLGPSWMGEQISVIDQQQQYYFISMHGHSGSTYLV